ncbi:MAG TPA: hypothetical protein VEL74_09625, partial [Thermoanaerobaculia bacterium]|nr:hypothetical protein [Thermoanaerobaculia bacterium]
EALGHFDTCSDCRSRAIAADPTLLFRRVPALELSPSQEAAEVEAVRNAVAAMRTAGRVEAKARRAHRLESWPRWAAAAALAVAALSLDGDDAWRLRPVPAPADRVEVEAMAPAPAVPAGTELAPAPRFEDLSRPWVYHEEGKDFAVAMFIAEDLEI